MDAAHTSLAAASLTFVGTHFALSHPLRAPLVRVLGANGFMAVYSLVAFAAMGWMALAFQAIDGGFLGGSGTLGWAVATFLTLPAMVLLLGSFLDNPALPAPNAEQVARKQPSGAFRVTRHPMMWSFALWGVSHIIMWWSWRTNIVALAVIVLALVGAHLQDRKKAAQMGDAWEQWQANTRYWPRWWQLPRVGLGLWLAGIAGWLAVTYAHIYLGDVAAGIWRWL